MSWLLRAAAVSVAALALTACAPTTTPTAAHAPRDCVTDFYESTDYYPVKTEFRHAKNVAVTYHDTYQVIEVKQPSPGLPAEKYVLHRCGTPTPELTGDLARAQVIETPVAGLYSESTTQLAMLAELERTSVVTGVANGSYVSNEEIRQRVKDGDVAVFAPNGTVNTESVIAGAPDVLVTSGYDDPSHAAIRQTGIPVIANAEWLEETPLGRAEWIKMMAALTGDEAKAAEVFDQVERDYTALADRAKDVETVTVLPGQMFQGTWSMPAGEAYGAVFLTDAGGTYAWSDLPGTVSQQLSFEEVLGRGRDAEVWLMSINTMRTKDDITAADPRYAEFAAFQADKVWNTTAQITPEGGNDYWERGTARPDLVLADLVKILHPDLVPEHELIFYAKVD